MSALLACREMPGPVPLVRFIAEDPSELLRLGDLVEGAPVGSWSFRSEAAVSAWEFRKIDQRLEVSDGSLILRSSSDDPHLIAPVDLDSTSVDAIRITYAAEPASHAELYFARPGEPLAEERKVFAISRSRDPLVYDFDVSAHPSWKGRIGTLRLDPTTIPGEEVRIAGITAVRFSGIPRARIPERAWKLDVDDEVRNVLPAPPGSLLERRVVVPPGGVLSFGFALVRIGRDPEPVTFRVRVGSWTGTETVFEEALDPTQAADRWHDRRLDLSRWAGRTVDVRLDTSRPEAPDPVTAFPVWAHPELVQHDRGPDRGPNVVLVSLDTLRADHLSLYGYERKTSPRLDAWGGRSGVVFEHAVAPSPWTLPSHVSLLSGLRPTRHGVNHPRDRIPREIVLLAERLRESGFATAAITGGGYLHPSYGFARGFDRYRYWPGIGTTREPELEAGIGRAIEFVERSSDRPFFLFLHTYGIHTPYRAREPFFSGFGGEAARPEAEVELAAHPEGFPGYVHRNEWRWLRERTGENLGRVPLAERATVERMYDSGIAHADALLGRLLERLRVLGLERETLVVVTSDHGELFGEHGLVGHSSLHDPVLLVPLVFALPGVLPGGTRVGAQVELVDVPVTILDLLEVAAIPDADGRSLRPAFGSAPVPSREAWSYAPHSNYGISIRTHDQRKYIANPSVWDPVRGSEALYDLSSDPGEERDLADDSVASALAPLREKVRRELEDVPGLRVRLSNAEAEPLDGVLGFEAPPTSVISTDLRCSCLERRPDGTLGFRVPPRESFVLTFEVPPRGTEAGTALAVTGRLGASRFDSKVDPRSLETPWIVAHSNGEWVEGRSGPSPATGVEIWQVGPVPPAERPSIDPDLGRQLRALGYVQ